MIPDERRAYVRARLVALAEEVRMARTPVPTEAQLRQHALDRAIAAKGDQPLPAEAITKAADVFLEYLRGPTTGEPEVYYDEDTLRKVYVALANAGVTDQTQAMLAVTHMQNAGILFRERAER